MVAEVGRVDQECQRDLEDFGDFAWIRHGDVITVDHRHHRQHPEPGDGHQRVEQSDRRDLVDRDTDLFAGFTQRRGDRVGIVRLDPPTRETDLSGMVAQRVGTTGQQHGGPGRMRDQSDQYRGVGQPGGGYRQPFQFGVVPAGIGNDGVQRLERGTQLRDFLLPGRRAAAHPVRPARPGNTSSISRNRSSSLIRDQPAISLPVR